MKRLVFIVAGLVLLFASVMKAFALAGTTVSPQKISPDWWLQLASVGVELVLGSWLLAGVWPRIVRVVVALAFGTFAVVAAVKLVQGEQTCGCLGHLAVHPAVMLALDLLLGIALCCVRVPAHATGKPLVPVFFLACVAVLATGVGLKVYSSATELSRGLTLDATKYEFGDVEQNQVYTHEFTLTNNTPHAVEVVQTTSTCGCTTVKDLTGRAIAPGESVAVPVTLKTGDSDATLIGRITLYCRTVGSDNPPSFFQDLVVTGKVQPDYWVRPLVVDFGVVDSDAAVTKVFRLWPNRMPDVRIRKVVSNHSAYTTRVLDGRGDEGEFRVEVTFCGRGLSSSGAVETTLQLDTDSPHRPMIRLLARAAFRAPVTAEPDAVVIPSNACGAVERTVTVASVKPIRLTDITTTDPRLIATAEKQLDGRWAVKVTLSADTEQGVSGEVRFRAAPTDDTPAGETRGVVAPVFRLANPKGG